ncbi:contractile injection system tape measure protein [Arthrobacter sp. H20]|uniref:contractile injection system tape measure protein n=1 Tax=Arthrobacter sp. H20 TaxID=1267981 RepID=UPI00047A8411|nr:contractile injection system tape measure protein [Arthrobacter sp. H20]
MVQPTSITIRSQLLDVEVHGTESDALALQRRLPGMCADVLWPALEAALADVDPGDAHLSVERLAIDLAEVPLDRLESELAAALRREVVDYFRRNPPVRFAGGDRAPQNVVRHRTEAETVEDALLVFLRTGRLPWSFRVPPEAHLEQLVLATWGAADGDRAPPPAARARLREILAQPAARARLRKQFTPEFAITLLRTASPRLAASIKEVAAVLADPLVSAPARVAFMRRIRDAVFVAESSGREPGPAELLRIVWRMSESGEHGDPALAAALERQWPRVTGLLETAPDPAEIAQAGPARSAKPRPATSGLEAEADGIIVDNAGIVLLHPFLPRLLEGLGASDGTVLVDRTRALCLIHYLATGELTAPEYRLTLAKVICGVALDEPVEADAGLTKAETDEAAALLEAAIGHWEALRGTSPDALRNEFLMRPGVLSADADGDWLLRVESRTVDILLDQLPWGISMIGLPWMSGLLRVQWR